MSFEENEAIIEVNDLGFSYGPSAVLKNVTFLVEAGEFLGILGPNGSGKTTLLRCMTGTLKPSCGEVFLDGRRLFSMKRREVAKMVAVLPQEPATDFGFTVQEFVSMGRLPHLERFEKEGPCDQKKTKWAMEVTNTYNLRGRLITSLSGGEVQRVFLAKALAQDPRILFLDEPIAHMDMNYQVEMLDTVRSLNQECGLTVVAIMHEANLAAAYCDSLLLLSEGTVFDKGPIERVFTVENIEKLYGLDVIMLRHPVSGTGLVFPVYGEACSAKP